MEEVRRKCRLHEGLRERCEKDAKVCRTSWHDPPQQQGRRGDQPGSKKTQEKKKKVQELWEKMKAKEWGEYREGNDEDEEEEEEGEADVDS